MMVSNVTSLQHSTQHELLSASGMVVNPSMIAKLAQQTGSKQGVACLHLLIRGEHVGHFAAVEQVVDVLNKSLILDLSVAEEEDSIFGLSSHPTQDALQILPPLHLAIALRNLHLNTNSLEGDGSRPYPCAAGLMLLCLAPHQRVQGRLMTAM